MDAAQNNLHVGCMSVRGRYRLGAAGGVDEHTVGRGKQTHKAKNPLMSGHRGALPIVNPAAERSWAASDVLTAIREKRSLIEIKVSSKSGLH